MGDHVELVSYLSAMRQRLNRKGSGSTGPGIVGILIIGVAKGGKMWAEGPIYMLLPISADLPSLKRR